MKIKILPVFLLILVSLLFQGVFTYTALNSLGKSLLKVEPEETITTPRFSLKNFTPEAEPAGTVTVNDVSLPLKKLPENYLDDIVFKAKLSLSSWEKSHLLNFSVSEISGPQTTFTAGYQNLLDQDMPIFISTDSILHYLNTQNSLIYQNLVAEKLHPLLNEILENLILIHKSWLNDDLYLDNKNALESNLQIFQEAENLLNSSADKYTIYLSAKNKLAGFNGRTQGQAGTEAAGGWNKQAELMADALKKADSLSLWCRLYAAESFFSKPSPNVIVENDTGVEIIPFQGTGNFKLDFLDEQEFLQSLTKISALPAEKFFDTEVAVVEQGLLQPESTFSYQKTLYGKYLKQKTVLAFLVEAEAQNSYIEMPANVTQQDSHTEQQNSSLKQQQEIYLQPETGLFSNLASLLKYVYEGLDAQDLLTSYGSNIFSGNMTIFESLESIAGRELASVQITRREQKLLEEFLKRIVSIQSVQTASLEASYLTIVLKPQKDSPEKMFLGLVYNKLPEANPWLIYSENDQNFGMDYDVPLTEQAKGTVRIPVLMYHNISAQPDNNKTRHLYVTPEMFEEQMAYLVRKNYRSLTPKEFYDILKSGKNPEQKSVMITFDDGTYGHYQNAFPILKKYGLTGVFYIPSSKSAISRQKLREMSDNGMIIDSHSATHADLTKLTDDASFANEIQNSKFALQAATGKQVLSIAYPGCVAKSKAIAWTQSSGYLLGFSCGKVIDHRFSQRFVLSRLHIYNNFENYVRRLSGYYEIPANY